MPPTSVAPRQGVIRPASSVETFTNRAVRRTNAFWSAASHSLLVLVVFVRRSQAALLVATSTRELSSGCGDYAQQHHTALTLGSSACFGAASVLTSLQISWLLGAASGSSSTMRDW